MALKQQLHQRQVQKLILAPALQQAIKLLPLTNLDLIEVIDVELSQNPMLEVEEEVAESKSDEARQEGKDRDDYAEGDSGDTLDDDTIREIESYFQESFDNRFRLSFFEAKEAPPLENIPSKSESLWDHLDWQANLTFFDETDREIARFIIGNINEDGYLITSLDEIAETLKASREKIEGIREKIRGFDPVGVASLTLKECLLTQLDALDIQEKNIRTIVDQHLPLLEKSDFLQLAKKMGVSVSKIRSYLDVIKGLEPAPGRKYSQERTYYVVPDIIVTKEEGELKITLNNEGVPRLRINSFYKKVLAKTSEDEVEACKFLREKMKKAFWFLRSLDQRNRTVYKVARFIVDKQKEFLEKGIDYIRPLTLVELAQEIGVHESTVGRVVSNKHMMTHRGVFPLKYFFHKSLSDDSGEDVSSLRVKERIRKLIESEDKKSPLSDIEIESILSRENLRIARRTVAKYRKQLRIAPSHIRKRQYWMEEAK